MWLYAAPGEHLIQLKSRTSATPGQTSLTDYPNLNDFIVWKDNYGMRCGIDAGSSSYWATLDVPETVGIMHGIKIHTRKFTRLYSKKSPESGCMVLTVISQLEALA